MPRIMLDQGPVHFGDTGGDGPVVLFVHGLLTDGGIWDGVVRRLAPHARCLTPTLPMGSHTEAFGHGADCSPRGVARLLDAFLAELDLDDVVVVGSDSGGAVVQLLVTELPGRIGRLVLLPCDAFEGFFPPMFRPYQWMARVPPLLTAVLQPMRLRRLRRLPMAYGRVTKHGIPDAVTDRWLAPALADRGVRGDLTAFLRGVDARDTLAAAERLPAFAAPALLLWPREERTFPWEHAERLAALLPDSRLVEVPDAWAFVQLDQPEATASALAAFLAETAQTPTGSADAGMAPAGRRPAQAG